MINSGRRVRKNVVPRNHIFCLTLLARQPILYGPRIGRLLGFALSRRRFLRDRGPYPAKMVPVAQRAWPSSRNNWQLADLFLASNPASHESVVPRRFSAANCHYQTISYLVNPTVEDQLKSNQSILDGVDGSAMAGSISGGLRTVMSTPAKASPSFLYRPRHSLTAIAARRA